MIFSLVYYLICAGIIFGSDDGKPWKFSDYILLLFAGIYAPLSVGVYIGKHLREHKGYIRRINLLYGVYSSVSLERQIVALEVTDSNSVIHPIKCEL